MSRSRHSKRKKKILMLTDKSTQMIPFHGKNFYAVLDHYFYVSIHHRHDDFHFVIYFDGAYVIVPQTRLTFHKKFDSDLST